MNARLQLIRVPLEKESKSICNTLGRRVEVGWGRWVGGRGGDNQIQKIIKYDDSVILAAGNHFEKPPANARYYKASLTKSTAWHSKQIEKQ